MLNYKTTRKRGGWVFIKTGTFIMDCLLGAKKRKLAGVYP